MFLSSRRMRGLSHCRVECPFNMVYLMAGPADDHCYYVESRFFCDAKGVNVIGGGKDDCPLFRNIDRLGGMDGIIGRPGLYLGENHEGVVFRNNVNFGASTPPVPVSYRISISNEEGRGNFFTHGPKSFPVTHFTFTMSVMA